MSQHQRMLHVEPTMSSSLVSSHTSVQREDTHLSLLSQRDLVWIGKQPLYGQGAASGLFDSTVGHIELTSAVQTVCQELCSEQCNLHSSNSCTASGTHQFKSYVRVCWIIHKLVLATTVQFVGRVCFIAAVTCGTSDVDTLTASQIHQIQLAYFHTLPQLPCPRAACCCPMPGLTHPCSAQSIDCTSRSHCQKSLPEVTADSHLAMVFGCFGCSSICRCLSSCISSGSQCHLCMGSCQVAAVPGITCHTPDVSALHRIIVLC